MEAEKATRCAATPTAPSALTALSQSRRPTSPMLDIKMPRMDGMELLRRLRQKTDLPVIFLTSKDEEIDEVLGLRMGADDYMRKPFSQRLLIERVRAVLRRREAAEVTTRASAARPTSALRARASLGARPPAPFLHRCGRGSR